MSSHRVVLPASGRSAPPSATAVGPVPPDQVFSVSLIVRRKKPLRLAELGGRVLSYEEFDREYAGNPEDFARLRQFAALHGLAVDEHNSSLSRRTLVLRGTAAALEQAFGVQLKMFEEQKHQRRFHGFEGEVSMTADHAEMVEAVLGLDARPLARPHCRYLARNHAGTAQSFTPVQVAQLYNFPAGSAAGQTIGLIELGGGYTESDVQQYFQSLGQKPPTVVAVSGDGGANTPGDPSGADGEVALDIQVSAAVAPGAKIAVYFAPNTDQGFTDAVTTAVQDQTNKPSVLSISWGGPESGWSQSALTALDDAFQSAAALGISITAASGDNGSTDGTSTNTVDFPASSPYVLACGGTELQGSGGSISSEVVWNDLATGGGATGGGVSAVFPLPAWQQGAGVPAPQGGKGGRGVPDVAGDAAPATGYSILVNGQKEVVGGTSAVSPLWAGLLALTNAQRGTRVGLLHPVLYQNPKALRDITQGSNGSFQARPGWDACTGLGSPNGTAVAAALAGTTSTGTPGDKTSSGTNPGNTADAAS